MGLDGANARVNRWETSVGLTYRIDAAKRLVSSTGCGEMDGDACVSFLASIAADGDFDPKFDHLCDLTGVERVRMDVDAAEAIVTSDPFAGSSRHAVVVASMPVFGVARMLQSLSEGRYEMRIFRAMAEARDWLGLG